MAINPFVIPRLEYDETINDSANIFRDRFGGLDVSQWESVVSNSINEEEISGILFPRFPSEVLQARIHGATTTLSSVQGAFRFYRYVNRFSRFYFAESNRCFLDFGAGWGRVTIPFMRDFPLRNMFGFEPNLLFCSIARTLNPYITFLTGGYSPDNSLLRDKFNLVVSWSIFSHLSELSARTWLREIYGAVRPGGIFILTTWGERFLNELIASKARLRDGQDVQWYQKVCIEAAGDIELRKAEFQSGDFVWFTGGKSNLYGEAFVSRTALQRLLDDEGLTFEVVEHDTNSLLQDAFVLRKVG